MHQTFHGFIHLIKPIACKTHYHRKIVNVKETCIENAMKVNPNLQLVGGQCSLIKENSFRLRKRVIYG